MPRLPPSLFWRAKREISPLAAQLLPACRDLQSAANELRWIREHVRDTKSPIPPGLRVWNLVEERAKGIPLQYVLGSQPFGDLDIKCRPGVLIPRPETESYILHLATILSSDQRPPKSLSILDLCTGTGCIPLLLLHSLLNSPTTHHIPISLHGVDISPAAIALARANQHHNTTTHANIPPPSASHPYNLTFSEHDIFSPTLIPSLSPLLASQSSSPNPQLDLLISNPPYISQHDFHHTTARSVRNHEPKLALVPPFPPRPIPTTDTTDPNQPSTKPNPHPADTFYHHLLTLLPPLRPERLLMEVGSLAQAVRVVQLASQPEYGLRELGYGTVEIWRDEPSAGDKGEREIVAGREVVVRGEGRGRAVFLEVGV